MREQFRDIVFVYPAGFGVMRVSWFEFVFRRFIQKHNNSFQFVQIITAIFADFMTFVGSELFDKV